MKNLELEKFIQGLTSPLYSFAYTLIPDDLQAGQLFIDAVSVFMIQKTAMVEKWTAAKGSEPRAEYAEYQDEVKIHLYKILFELSKKRFSQLKMGFEEAAKESAFFSLDFEDKAALFLRERGQFPLETIEFILGKMRPEVLAHLQRARTKMIDHYAARNHN